MTTKEIPPIIHEPNLHKVWEITINDTKTLLKRYGSGCIWNKLTLEKDSREVYKIELSPHYILEEDKGTRKEYFLRNKEVSRVYVGDKFSFIEYIHAMDILQALPNKDNLEGANLEKEIFDIYDRNAKIIFSL